MKSLTSFLSLFTSVGTLVCCALPAFLVTLGLGATLASLVSAVPGLIWMSEHKLLTFGVAGTMLAIAGVWHWKSRATACPVGEKEEACKTTKSASFWIYVVSVGIYLVGVVFAIVAPRFMS